jgi:glucosamine--fructose-6-phosphate aminotransferase (isomerizing)
MTKSGSYTYNEITSQPTAWAQALEVTTRLQGDIDLLWNNYSKLPVIFTGCGSTYYLSLAAAALFRELASRAAMGVPAGELLLYPDTFYRTDQPHILVAISRSGTTSETIAAAKRFREMKRGPVVVITNDGSTPLADLGDITIAIPAGQEKSVAQTRSFASMYIAAVALAVQVADRDDLRKEMTRLPGLGERLLVDSLPIVKTVGENLDLDSFYFLGSGSRYGLACETNLKMKEMTLTHSEPFHFLEFRHGPMSMVRENVIIIGLRSMLRFRYEQAVLNEMKVLGGQVFAIADRDADLCFNSGLPEEVLNVLYLPPLQLMAYYRSLARGLNPDQPHNLTAVVQLDLG